ncbi:hypothetical protein ACLIYP_04005 [Streptomyces nanhaiensis]|uniref:hypothetical protein n=1 Tax=Streptomyces nanhaiensis TaxID=679319 RepID=UPI00399D27BA
MAVHGHTHGHRGFRLPVWRTTRTAPASGETAAAATAVPAASAAARALAGLRFATGFVFLWAFADKTFGLGYATPAERAWTEGGSPTEGFLSGVAVGPLESFFHDIAGAAWADWLFMLGLLGIGLALTAGVALRLTAVAGTVMMALMWAAEWPLAQHLSDGSPSMSTNPIVNYHVMYAAVMIVLAVAAAGDTWGLGRRWARLPLVRSLPWLR